jgi:hypothetical protein
MATGQENKLRGAAGEFLVAAELCRRGLLATPFAGNVPYFDIIACGKSKGHVAIQVKAIDQSRSKWWQFDIRKYIDVQMDADGKHQKIGALQSEPYEGLMFVLVELMDTGKDKFFILEWSALRDILASKYRGDLAEHGYLRPRNPESFHTAIGEDAIRKYQDDWEAIVRRVS